MKHIFLLAGFLLISQLFQAQSAQYQWGFKVGNSSTLGERPTKITVDSNGDIYTAGYYQDVADFNPNGVATNLSGISTECYVAKYNSAGVLVWAKNIGMANLQEGTGLTVHNNQLILVGNYGNGGGIDLDPGPGTVLTPTVNNNGMFISKFDLNGNFIWGNGFACFSKPVIEGVKIDNANNIVVCGNFQYTIDFDPSASTASLTATSYDGFIAKYDSNGNYVWAMKIGTADNDLVNDLCIDINNNIYCTGSYMGTVNFNPLGTTTNLTSNVGVANAFVAKYGANGVLKWANAIGSTSTDIGRSIQFDKLGNIIYAGVFGGVVDFDAGVGVTSLTANTANRGIFISKIDTANNFVWAKDFGGTLTDDISEIAIDSSNQIIATGMMSPGMNFSPSGTFNVTSKGSSDAYIAKYSKTGALVWAYPIGGSATDWGISLDVNQTDNTIYTTGYFNSTNLDLNISSTVNTTITTNGGEDIYIAKYSQCDIVSPPVNITPTVNLTMCEGVTTTLTASASGTINWYYSSTPLGTGNSITTFSVSGPGTYTWTADNTTSCGTSVKTPFVVEVIAKPTIMFSAPAYTACIGQGVSIGASGANSYTWSPGGMNTASVVITPTIAGSMPVIAAGTNSLGCVDTKTVYVSVQSPAIYTLQTTPSNSICLGQSVALNVIGGAYTYTWSTGVNTASISATPTVNSTYSVVVSNGTGCLKTSSVNVVVNTASVAITGNTLACANATTALTASGANTYTWSTGATSSSISVSPIATSIYSVTATSVSGCTATAVKTISVNPIPFINVVSSNPSLCNGTTATLTASGANTYTWNTSATTNTIVISPTVNATYSVQGSNLFGCLNSTVMTQSVIPSPTISVNSGSVCAGQSFTMIPSGASTYSYSNGSNVVTPIVNANYTVTGIGANGCASSNAAISSVTVNLLPTITVLSGAICSGQSYTMSPNGASTYTYSSGSAVVSPTTNANYTITGTSAEGCVGAGNTICSVQVYALPNIVAATNNTLLCSGQTATISATGANTYTWSTTENTNNIAVSPTTTSSYSVSGTDVNGCSNSAVITQSVSLCTGIAQLVNESSVSIFPNPFTNVITIKNSFEDYSIMIVDVLGKVVFEKQILSTETSIDLSELKTGFYQLIMKGESNAYTQKIIKQ